MDDAAAGSGTRPLSVRLSAGLWRAALAVGRRPSGPRLRLLTLCGIAVFVAMVLMWAALAWVGWWLVFSASDGAVVDVASGQPASLVERLQFAGAGMFALGSNELSTGARAWQFAAIGATATGIVFVTLANRLLRARGVGDGRRPPTRRVRVFPGRDPEEVLSREWTNGSVKGLEQHLVAITPMVHALAERHLNLPGPPVLPLRPVTDVDRPQPRAADETVTLPPMGYAPEDRPDPVTVEPLGRAIVGISTPSTAPSWAGCPSHFRARAWCPPVIGESPRWTTTRLFHAGPPGFPEVSAGEGAGRRRVVPGGVSAGMEAIRSGGWGPRLPDRRCQL